MLSLISARHSAATASRSAVRLAATASNPLLEQKSLPLFDTIDATHVKPAISTALNQLEEQFEALEAALASQDDPTYADVVEAMEVIEAPVEYSWGVVGHLMGVKNSDELRAAHSEMQPEVVKVTTKLSQSAAVYAALETVYAKSSGSVESPNALDPAQLRIVEASLKAMKLSGVGLTGEAKEKFNANRMELADLSTQFSNNVLDATKAFSLVLTDPADVEGLPASALSLAASRAVEGGHEGATAEAGPWQLGLDMPTYLPAMKFIKNRSVREKLYRAFVTRAGGANEPLIRRILTLRKEQAGIIGFETHAEVSIERKMASSVAAVEELTEMLLAKAMPAAKKELAELNEFAKSNGFDADGEDLALWDVPFWSERQSEQTFGFEEEELRPYFALPNVLEGLFALVKKIFGVDIVEATDEVAVWDPDVQFFHVKDEVSGEHIASFYLDPYARPKDKRGGAWMDVCIGKSSKLGRIPVAYLTCNGSPPVDGKPSLMTFSEVTTLFHETGHGLQHMLTTVPHKPAAGIENVEWDAVELPSQFMENFCFDEGTIYGSGLAKHYATGEPLPRDLFDKLCAQRTFQAGMGMVRQLYFGALDMALHHNYDPNGEQTPFQLQQELSKRFSVLPPLPDDRFLCGFGHIFSGGYSAGYYSYKWAEVLSADAFAAFEEVGLENDDAVREVGRRFRDTVLSMGGGTHPSEVFRLFRGRDPSPEALLRHSGLAD